VEALEADVVERHLRGERGDRADAVALRARGLAVAAGAKIALASRSHSVLADPVAIVDEMARGCGVLRGEVHVAGVAVTKVVLVLVLVAAEADSHFREERLGP
jgi:hypothetical protein